MKTFLRMVVIAGISLMFWGCGGGSSSSTTDSGSGGDATVDSLGAIPSVDLSQYDSSTSSSANVAVQKSLSPGLAKVFGGDQLQVGGASRAGCEQNMHKQEVFRMSQMSQLDRCYPERMEKVGLISAIPTGSYAYYRITPPEMGSDQQTGMCNDIPAERAEERADCLARMSSGPKTMLMRLGKVDNQLHIDMCEGDPAAQVNSATYGANGSLYTASVVRIGTFGGKTESGSFNMSIDIGNGSVVDNIATIGDNGYVSATGQMNGQFGSGNISFERAADSSVKISGAFAGGFDDPFSGTRTEFTGKTYSHVGGTPVTGCAKYSFSGTSPAMPVASMIPYNISAADQADFLTVLGAELGATLTIDSKLCPNPNFRPEDNDPTIKPMVLLAAGATSCGVMTNTGVECFSITNATTTTDFGTEVSQIFTIIANATAAYFTEVNAFDLSTLLPAITTIAFTRVWDCTGTFTDVNFASVARETVEAEMRKCMAIEEKARNNEGMGNEGQCEKNQQMDSINNLAEGGGGADHFGAFGGEFVKTGNGDCGPAPQVPERFFVNKIDEDTYCIPMDGSCSEFNMAGNESSGLNVTIGDRTMTSIVYAGAPVPPENADVSYGACSAPYDIVRPQFSAPPSEFGGPGGGDAPGEGGFIPQPCRVAGLTGPTDGEACHQLCMTPGTDCRP